MIIILLTCIYITFICLGWGLASVELLQKINTEQTSGPPHFSVICLLGLSVITALAGSLSIFIPLGTWYLQFFLAMPALLFVLKHKRSSWNELKKKSFLTNPFSCALLFCSLCLLLLMGSWQITHPDTIGYHAETIEWIKNYKAIPGLVHLHTRYGYQGLWFPVTALFNFNFRGTTGVSFINIAVLTWFLLFLLSRIDENLKGSKVLTGFLWLLLLIGCFWSYTAIRLTATSQNPDFIVTLFTWISLYLFIRKNSGATNLAIACCFSITAITIKLSALPLVLMILYSFAILLKEQKKKAVLVLMGFAALILSAFVSRNIISSGYPLFPSPFPDIAHVDWKLDKELAQMEKEYITAYAKTGVNYNAKEIHEINQSGLAQWMPAWWTNRSAADKTIVVMLLLSFLLSLIFMRHIKEANFRIQFTLIFLFGGIIFWFYSAPDPRFGAGFMIGFIAIISDLMFARISYSHRLVQKLILPAMGGAILCIGVYSIYRFTYFFTRRQVFYPLGIQQPIFKKVLCDGVEIKIPYSDSSYKMPESSDCQKFMLRGNTITDGFKARN
jgi:hypothetical protein